MPLKIFNTLTKKKEAFKPVQANKVKMFVCGPTVYDYSHIGHAKTYVQFDVIVRYLRHLGLEVFYLQNITDLDDKIIQRAKELGIAPKELAEKMEKEYYKDMESIGITSVTKYARATDFIDAILKQVKTLVEKGFAYETDDGIYFDLSKFKDYGKLSGRTTLEAEDAVSRIDEGVKKEIKEISRCGKNQSQKNQSGTRLSDFLEDLVGTSKTQQSRKVISDLNMTFMAERETSYFLIMRRRLRRWKLLQTRNLS